MSAAETEAIRHKAAAKRKRRTLRGQLRELTKERDAFRDAVVGHYFNAMIADTSDIAKVRPEDVRRHVGGLWAEIYELRGVRDDLRAVVAYCRDQFEWEKKFRGNEHALALKVARIVLGDPAPEAGSLFARVLNIAGRGE